MHDYIYYFLSIISLLDPYLFYFKCLIYCRLKTIPRNWFFFCISFWTWFTRSLCDFIPKVVLISFKCIYMMVHTSLLSDFFFVLTFKSFLSMHKCDMMSYETTTQFVCSKVAKVVVCVVRYVFTIVIYLFLRMWFL